MSKQSKGFGEVKQREVASLRPSQSNPRQHSPAQVDMLARAIKRFGFTTPLVIDNEGGIVAGHGRYLAAVKLGLKRVATIQVHGFSAVDKLAYVIADNQLATLPKYDADILGAELNELMAAGVDMEALGFDPATQRQFGVISGEDEGAAGGKAQALPAGKRWRIGAHTVALAGKARVESDAGLMLACRVGSEAIDYSAFKGPLAVVWTRDSTIYRAIEMEAAGFEIKYGIITPDDGDVGSGEAVKHGYRTVHLTGYIGRREVSGDWNVAWAGGRKQTTLWNDECPMGPGKVLIAPIDIRRRCITNHVARGGRVFDPCDEVGATLVAAQMEGRAADVIVKNRVAAERVLARLNRRVGDVAICKME